MAIYKMVVPMEMRHEALLLGKYLVEKHVAAIYKNCEKNTYNCWEKDDDVWIKWELEIICVDIDSCFKELAKNLKGEVPKGIYYQEVTFEKTTREMIEKWCEMDTSILG